MAKEELIMWPPSKPIKVPIFSSTKASKIPRINSFLLISVRETGD